MEKVIVVKRVPGILEEGDVLIADGFGNDFLLETKDSVVGPSGVVYRNSEKYVNLDYYTVSENIPEFFVFANTFDEMSEEGEPDMNFAVARTNEEILKRYEYFVNQIDNYLPGTEQDVVYHNLVWFIQWLTGQTDLIK